MTVPSKQFHCRLPADMARRFEGLVEQFPALPPAVVMRLLLSSVLEKSQEDQVGVILNQLRKPEARGVRRREGSNTKNRIYGGQ